MRREGERVEEEGEVGRGGRRRESVNGTRNLVQEETEKMLFLS